MTRKEWSNQLDVAIAKKLYDTTKSEILWKDIADTWGITYQAIVNRRNRRGFEFYKVLFDKINNV